MARVYQSKKVIGYQRPNIEPHEEDTLHEPKGMSFPAVPLILLLKAIHIYFKIIYQKIKVQILV